MNFTEIIISHHGEAGRAWLSTLPAQLESYAEEWNMLVSSPFENLSYNYVAPVTRTDGTLAVLKLGFPNDEFRSEIAALRHFDGRGMVRLLEADVENGAMLLEHISPGNTLWDADDEFATVCLLDVMPKLWCAYAGDFSFKTVQDWGKAFRRLREHHHGMTGKLDERLVHKGERIFFELLASSATPVLLHGDLHHDNLLSSQGAGYIAIDPKGVLGEPCYEVGAFLRNPWHTLLERKNPKKIMQRRVDMIVERLGFDRQRIIGWAFSQAVLSAIWCEEGGSDCADWALSVAEIFERL